MLPIIRIAFSVATPAADRNPAFVVLFASPLQEHDAGIPNSAAPPIPLKDPETWVTVQDYPTCNTAPFEGTTRYRLTVGVNGRALQCHIVDSSGFKVLDEATCRNAMRRARFTPSTDARGMAVNGFFEG